MLAQSGIRAPRDRPPGGRAPPGAGHGQRLGRRQPEQDRAASADRMPAGRRSSSAARRSAGDARRAPQATTVAPPRRLRVEHPAAPDGGDRAVAPEHEPVVRRAPPAAAPAPGARVHARPARSAPGDAPAPSPPPCPDGRAHGCGQIRPRGASGWSASSASSAADGQPRGVRRHQPRAPAARRRAGCRRSRRRCVRPARSARATRRSSRSSAPGPTGPREQRHGVADREASRPGGAGDHGADAGQENARSTGRRNRSAARSGLERRRVSRPGAPGARRARWPVRADTATGGSNRTVDRASRSATSASTRSIQSGSTRSALVTTGMPAATPSCSSTARCSTVCGMIPSSAAMTSSARSIPEAPATMVRTKSSWPGTSTTPGRASRRRAGAGRS